MSTPRPIAVEARSIPPHSNIEVTESSEPTESSALLPSSQSSIARPRRPIPTSILRKPTATRIIELLIASILLAFIIPSVQYFFDPLPAPESAVAHYAVYDSIQIISNTGGHTKVMVLNYGPDNERIAVGFQLRSKSPRAYRSTHTRIDLINGSTLLINVTFPPPSLFYPSDIHIDLAIYIPRSLVSFNLTGESASLVWQAPPITSLFTMSVENGDFFTVSQLSPRNGLHIYTGNGRIDIDSPVTLAKSITLHSERGGGVMAAGLDSMGKILVSTGVEGKILVVIHQRVENGLIQVKSVVGDVVCMVYGFKGRYLGEHTHGNVWISGLTIPQDGINPSTGWAGEIGGAGILEVRSEWGNIQMLFDYPSLKRITTALL